MSGMTARLVAALRQNAARLSAASVEDLSQLESLLIERGGLLAQWESLRASDKTNEEHARILAEVIESGRTAEHRIRLARAFAVAELKRLGEFSRAQRAFGEGLPTTAPDYDIKG